MSYLKPAVLLTAVSLASGCANFSPIFSDDIVEDAPQQTSAELVVPAKYADPTKSTEFHLAEGSATAKRETSLTSPSSILEIFPGSWVNKDDPHPYKVIIEKSEEIDDLAAFIALSIKELVKGRGYTSTQTGNTYNIVAKKSVETGFWLWSSETEAEEFTFNINVDVKPHGRTAEISVDPIDYKKLDEANAPKFSAATRTQQLAVEMVNQVSIEMNFQNRLANQRNNASQQVTLTFGQNSAEEYVITSQYEIKQVFKEFDDVIEALGFDIEEEDDKLFSYTVEYDKDDASVISSLFESRYARRIDIPAGTYEVVFMSSVDGVHVTFADEFGKALPQTTMKEIFDLVVTYANEEELDL